jgi:hypothetical protein
MDGDKSGGGDDCGDDMVVCDASNVGGDDCGDDNVVTTTWW